MSMPVNKNNRYGLGRILLLLGLFVLTAMFSGCGEDGTSEDTFTESSDTSAPESASWDMRPIIELSEGSTLAPQAIFAHSDDRLHMAWFAMDSDESANQESTYRIQYKSFPLDSEGSPDISAETFETVVVLDNFKGGGGLSMALSGDTPIIAYSVFKQGVVSQGSDYNNQGDVMIAVRDGDNAWRNEIAAYGYVSPDRNPALADGLAGSNFSLNADHEGNALLSFQFYYEGIDSYNMEFPDLRFILQPVNHFDNGNVNAVADMEQTVEGNVYYSNGSGIQNNQGAHNDLLVDTNGELVVFYFADTTTGSSKGKKGLRVARTESGVWQNPEWIDTGIDIVDIDAVVKSNGKLFVVYTVKDEYDVMADETIPFSLRFAENLDVVSEDGSGEETEKWQTGSVNHTSINGRYCSVSLDSLDNPVIAYFDEMNFTRNRFFSRIKISSRTSKGAWNVDVISPEDIGLSNTANPYEIDPGAHDTYYIGKYNELWVDGYDRVHVCSYSSVTNKAYHFVHKETDN